MLKQAVCLGIAATLRRCLANRPPNNNTVVKFVGFFIVLSFDHNTRVKACWDGPFPQL